MKTTRRAVLGGTASALALAAGTAQAEAGDAIRPLVLICKPQAVDPAQYPGRAVGRCRSGESLD